MRIEAELIGDLARLHVSHARPVLQQNPVCNHVVGRFDLGLAGQGQLVAADEKRARASQAHAHVAAQDRRPVTQGGAVVRVHGEIRDLRSRVQRCSGDAHTVGSLRLLSRAPRRTDGQHGERAGDRQAQLRRETRARLTKKAEISHGLLLGGWTTRQRKPFF